MSATARPTRGLLSQQAWAAIARMYAAGDGGLVLYFSTVWRSVASWEIAPKWSTVVRLRNRKVPYVEEVKIDGETCVRLTVAGRAHYEANLDRYRTAYPEVEVPGPGSPEALHRADPMQLHADIEHRRQLIALADAEVEARGGGNTAESVRLHGEAESHRQPSACGHWSGRDRAFGASCGHRRPPD
jgi:hypothetical protein